MDIRDTVIERMGLLEMCLHVFVLCRQTDGVRGRRVPP